MIAAFYREPGASSVLTVGEVETPVPGPGEVRVRLRVAGVNPTDWKSRAGAEVKFAFQVPGQDGAGEIDAVGAGVDPDRVGEGVWVYFAAYQRQFGTAAQYTVVPAAHAVPLPLHRFPLEHTADAHDAVESGAVGKVVIDIP